MKAKPETSNEQSESAPVIIGGARVTKQPNGDNLYLFLEGKEGEIQGAYETLYNLHAFDIAELEQLTDNLAMLVLEEESLAYGLFVREYFRITADPEFARSHKGVKGGYKHDAEEKANDAAWALLDSIPSVRYIRPNQFTPKVHSIGSVNSNSRDRE